MLPPNLINFIERLTERTNRGDFVWSFDGVNAVASIKTGEFRMEVVYWFNETDEVGEFNVRYAPKMGGSEFRFSTSQIFAREYRLVQALYQAAQGSAIKFPF